MLLEGEPTRRLNSTPRIRKLVNNRTIATKGDIETIKEWLIEEFLTLVNDVTEVDI